MKSTKGSLCSLLALLLILFFPLFAAAAVSESVAIVEKVTPTYAISGVAVTPAATPTDVLVITGSATKTVHIRRIVLSGMATTAGSMDVSLVRRMAADTGGTSTAPTIVQADSNSVAATATVALYSVNPSALGTSAGMFTTKKLNFGLTGTAGTIDFTWPDVNYIAPLLHGTGQSIAINFNGGAVPSGGTITYAVEWEEF